MKTRPSPHHPLGVVIAGLGIAFRVSAGFVYENATEFSAGGDFDGNGLGDVVIVDRATGTYRLGFQVAPNSFHWAQPRAGGLAEVTGVHIGRVLNTTSDALILTSPEVNRLNVISATSTTVAGLPQAFFSPAVGPSLAVALDIGGAGNTALEDLVVGSVLNDGPTTRVEALRNTGSGGALQVLSAGDPGGTPRRGNRILLKSGQPEVAIALVKDSVADRLKAMQLSTGALVSVIDGPVGPPNDLDYVYAFFNPANTVGQFLFYQQGGSQLILRPVAESNPGVFALGAPVPFNMSESIYQVFVLSEGSSPRLLVISEDGAVAKVYDFNGSSAPALVSTFTAVPGEEFTGAAGLSGGGLLLFRGMAGTGLTSSFARYTEAAGSYTLQEIGALPAISAVSHRANVMTFQFEPFVDPAPNLLQSFNAGDWTSLYVPQGAGQANVTFETFLNSLYGLGEAATQTLSPITGSAGFSLVNQYREPLSLFRFGSALGSEIANVKIQPSPGTYKTSVTINFVTGDPLAQIYYRTVDATSWNVFTQPFWIFQDTTISFYAAPSTPGSPLKSAIHTAKYRFTDSPPTMDSDGDGVPDYVEIGNGLDPVGSGSDGDGDGYTDLEELIAGKSPTDANNHPSTGAPRPDLHGVVDLIQAPQAVDGASGLAADAAHGMTLRAFDLTGDLLAAGSTTLVPVADIDGPAAVLSNVVVAIDHELVAATTEPHFDIVTTQTDKRIGREMIRLWDLQTYATPVSLPVTWSGGALPQETAAWVAAATIRVSTAERVQVAGNVTPYDTLSALLVEQKIRQILLDRSLSEFGGLTLFPWRPGDADRPRLSTEAMLALAQRVTVDQPGFRLTDLLAAVEASLGAAPPNDPAGALKALTWEVYRVSSASNNPPAGAVNWPFYPSPVDTLREFLVSGVVHSNYLSASTTLAGLASTAFTQSQSLLDGIGGRPVVDLNLRIRPDTFDGGCVLLDTLDGASTRSLFNAHGNPFEFVDSFTLPIGTVIRVVGYDDVTSLDCPANALEVISAELLSPPSFAFADIDGDLLPDGLEWALFGNLLQNGFDDNDGDGAKNLQELLDGTDPSDAGDKGVPVANFNLPAVQLQWALNGQLKMQWQWSASYASKVQFGVQGGPDLNGVFTQLPAVQTYLGNDTFEVSLPDQASDSFFYQLFMTLP